METTEKSSISIFCLFLPLALALFYLTITNMAGIYIVSDLGGNTKTSIYAMVFFGLGNALTIPLAYPLANRLGMIRTLSFSLLFFAFFSLLCAIASTYFLFNIFRCLQGASAGFFFILSRKLILHFSSIKKSKLLSFIMVLCYATIPVFGSCFGATIAYAYSWRYLFLFILVPSLWLFLYFWTCQKKHADLIEEKSSFFDGKGYIFFACSIISILTAITLAQELDWLRSKIFLILVFSGCCFGLLFLYRELTYKNSLFSLKLLKRPLLLFTFLSESILFSSYFGMISLILLWLTIYANYTPLWINGLIGIEIITATIAYFVCFRFIKMWDLRFTLSLGILSLIFSCYLSTYFNPEVDFFHLAFARFFSGLGIVLFLFPLYHLSQYQATQQEGDTIFFQFQLTRTFFTAIGAASYITLWDRREIFFHERLGENLTINSQLVSNYFNKASDLELHKQQSLDLLNIYLNEHATSLGLNDTYAFIGYILTALLILTLFSFSLKKHLKTF